MQIPCAARIVIKLFAPAMALATAACTSQPGIPPPLAAMAQYKIQMRDVLTLPDVIYLDNNADCGCILVGIAVPTAAVAVQNFALANGVPAAAVRSVASHRRIAAASLRDNIRPVKGGLQIQTNAGRCTMMATVFHRARGQKGLVTNSHCTATRAGVDGTDFFQPGGDLFGGDFVAREVIDPPLSNAIAGCPTGRLCRRSDAAFAEFTTSTVGIIGQLARPTHFCSTGPCDLAVANSADALQIIGVGGAAIVGEERQKIGRTTGWTRGRVISACVDTNVSNPDRSDSGITLLCQNYAVGSWGRGDSGSPLFELLTGNRIVLAGIVWGGSVDEQGATIDEMVFTAMPEIEAELGAMDFF